MLEGDKLLTKPLRTVIGVILVVQKKFFASFYVTLKIVADYLGNIFFSTYLLGYPKLL